MSEGYTITAGGRAGGVRELWARRGLLWSLTLRELQVRYRQAFLGILWAVLQPVALMLVTTAVFHRFLRLDAGDVPYPVFVFTALVPWTFFHTAVSTAVPSLVSNAELVRKIHFPREALPLAGVGAVLVDLLVGLVLWLAMVFAYGYPPTIALLHIPVLLVLLVAAAAAVALLFSAINVYFRDVKHALPLLLQVLFFATPIVYRLDAVPERWRGVFFLNPLTAVVEGLRAVAFEGGGPDGALLGRGALSAFALLIVSYLVFKRADRRFADVV